MLTIVVLIKTIMLKRNSVYESQVIDGCNMTFYTFIAVFESLLNFFSIIDVYMICTIKNAVRIR
jgi:hypothetical protein